MDIVIPIVFPDYLIRAFPDVDLGERLRGLPGVGRIPGIDKLPVVKGKVPDLGHAGVLFINGTNGVTKYYEFGRYDAAQRGLVRKPHKGLTDARVNRRTGKLDRNSLKQVLKEISRKAGQGGRIEAAYIEVSGGYEKALKFVTDRMALNTDPERAEYKLLSNSCLHFMRETAVAAGAAMPWVIDPRPTAYIQSVRKKYSDLDYDPKSGSLAIGDAAE